jgi:hypothetical protein
MRSHFTLLGGITIASAIVWSCSLTTELPEMTTGGGPLAVLCDDVAQCPGRETECVTRSCDDGVCGEVQLAPGTVLPSQVEGDCVRRECAADGSIVTADDTEDFYSDGLECTRDACVNGLSVNDNREAGATCSVDKQCNDIGACVECLENIDCDGHFGCDPDTCVCDKVPGLCVLESCQNDVQDAGETALNCGGMDCAPCDVGQHCEVGTDCVSGSCDPITFVCLVPSCDDGVTNGTETDLDCGGGSSGSNCEPCPTDAMCIVPQDCESLVCSGANQSFNTCRAPTCTDGVTNSVETDVDCGGGKCNGCVAGQHCLTTRDCKTKLVCNHGICAVDAVVVEQPVP